MEYQSRPIDSNQTGIHDDLTAVVTKVLRTNYRKPFADHSLHAFEAVNEEVSKWNGPVVLDSCCGVGESTLELAKRHPDALVVGVDKSAHRLAKNDSYRGGKNCAEARLVRADLNDFWRLAREANWPISHHYILYPNPWPKQKHLTRRWHAGGVFPTIVALGGQLELRSNWPIYLQEFARALEIAGHNAVVSELPDNLIPITPFERKYQATGQALWRLQSNLC